MNLGWVGYGGVAIALATSPSVPAMPAAAASLPAAAVCPATVEALMPPLLRDLPAYGNRVFQRSRLRSPADQGQLYLLFAGQPEFEPLPLAPGTTAPEMGADQVYQVFFTTRERRYEGGRLANFQNFHWVFLTRTEQGWHLAQMFSRISDHPTGDRPPSPPFDSTEGVIGRAIRDWLRDCATDNVKLP